MSSHLTKLLSALCASMMLVLGGCATTGVQEPQIERISEQELERIMPKPVAKLSLDEIVKLSKDGLPAEQIIDRIRVSNSQYDLTPSQAVDLSKQGVDAKVLDYIHQTREQALRDAVADEFNRREQARKEQEKRLNNELRMRSMRYYDPWWGYSYGPGYGPYWRRPFYGPSFRYGWGW